MFALRVNLYRYNAVMIYPDSRRKALTCGGGAVGLYKLNPIYP